MSNLIETTDARDLEEVSKIDGWLTDKEAAVLYGLARRSTGPIGEIGSWRGRSTAALALGSMRGRKQPVYAIDPFCGPQEGARPTSLGSPGTDKTCSPELLRYNLDKAGVNGLVRIVPKASQDALPHVPEEFGLLFIDGAHDYESVCRDIDLYTPRLKQGGFVVFHDVVPGDPGVVRAVEDRILSQPRDFRVMDRIDSAMVVRKVKTEQRSVYLALPGFGWKWNTLGRILQASLGAHKVETDNNGNGFDDLNVLWERALNKAEAGEITHWIQLHSDIIPPVGFVDLLIDEIEETGADLVSVACAMKDTRGVLNCGMGSLSNHWGAWRRLTDRELPKLPPTFGLQELRRLFGVDGDEDKYLLHNFGCVVADLRKPIFYQTDGRGNLASWFDFPTRNRRNAEGRWAHNRESEDWFFSRKFHGLGGNGLVTQKLLLHHVGEAHFTKDGTWGSYENGDDDTAPNWRKPCSKSSN